MVAGDSAEAESGGTGGAGESIYRVITEVLLTGIAIIVPFVVTVYILQVALGFIRRAIQPFSDFLGWTGLVDVLANVGLVTLLIEVGIYSDVYGFITEIIGVAILLGTIVGVGVLARHPHGERFIQSVDLVIESIPGIGTVYKSFRRMGDIMLNDEVENFKEVKLVRLLGEEMYVIGFVVGRAPDSVQNATTNEDVLTMFLPLAPNPVTGGFLAHIPAERTIDVDMTVEEGVRSIITSGIAGSDGETSHLTVEEIEELVDENTPNPSFVPGPVSGLDADSDETDESD